MSHHLAGALATVGIGVVADQAAAAYTAKVDSGVLRITGNNASDTLALRHEPTAPNILLVDVGADGTAEFSFDRTTFTAIEVRPTSTISA